MATEWFDKICTMLYDKDVICEYQFLNDVDIIINPWDHHPNLEFSITSKIKVFETIYYDPAKRAFYSASDSIEHIKRSNPLLEHIEIRYNTVNETMEDYKESLILEYQNRS
jgi:hypothetical protein